MWSGCDVSGLAPAKNAKQNKTKQNFWVALSRVKSHVGWGILIFAFIQFPF